MAPPNWVTIEEKGSSVGASAVTMAGVAVTRPEAEAISGTCC